MDEKIFYWVMGVAAFLLVLTKSDSGLLMEMKTIVLNNLVLLAILAIILLLILGKKG